ncbi:hypothetical protein AZ54_22270 [Xanthomonas oryzae pv. oryzae PXO86]|nr:hypothetical protein AZ54_22270 [Xanthomonas oryzae pv. oryzae PXO86]
MMEIILMSVKEADFEIFQLVSQMYLSLGVN